MPINVRDRQRELARWLRLQYLGEIAIAPKASKALRAAFLTSSKPGLEVEIAAQALERELRMILRAELERIGKLASGDVIKAAKGLPGIEAKWGLDDFLLSFTSWIVTRSLFSSTTVANTFRDRVRGVIEEGVREGEGERGIGKRILAIGAVQTLSWARTIARTETHQAASEAQERSIQGLRIPAKTKEWIAAGDKRTRDDHRDADGQTVAMDEDFRVGGEYLARPGDGSKGASARNLVNCRCAWIVNT